MSNGIGGGAQIALAEAEIKLYGGVSGDADEAVNAYLEGKLDFNPNVQCSHHAHEHSLEDINVEKISIDVQEIRKYCKRIIINKNM